MNRVLVGSGPLVASLSEQDEHHEICVAELKELSTPLLTCWPMPLQRDVAVLLAGIGVALIFEGAECNDDASAGLGRFDDGVYVAAFGGNEGIGEAFAEFGDFFLAQFFSISFRSFVQFAFVDDIYRAFRSHHRNFRHRPGKVCVSADVF
jgi:hypothetical protein